jgi:hypothetical protein
MTEKKDDGLERICKIYLDLTDDEKEKIITLGEGLLKSQKSMDDVNYKPTEEKEGNNEKD